MLIVVDEERRPIGIFAERDAAGYDRFTQLQNVMTRDLVLVDENAGLEAIFDELNEHRLSAAPVVDGDGRLVGVVTRRGALRSTIYTPALNAKGELMSAVAVGISANSAERAKALAAMGCDVIVVDTAHGHQGRMLRAIEAVRARRRRPARRGGQRGDAPGRARPHRRRRRHRQGGHRARAPCAPRG